MMKGLCAYLEQDLDSSIANMVMTVHIEHLFRLDHIQIR